jgi:hypothetical protein
MKYFEFPDGFNTSIGALRFDIPEILFDPRFITPVNFYIILFLLRYENIFKQISYF